MSGGFKNSKPTRKPVAPLPPKNQNAGGGDKAVIGTGQSHQMVGKHMVDAGMAMAMKRMMRKPGGK